MNGDHDSQSELDALLRSIIDAPQSFDKYAQLSSALEASSTSREAFVDHLILHAMLESELTSESVDESNLMELEALLGQDVDTPWTVTRAEGVSAGQSPAWSIGPISGGLASRAWESVYDFASDYVTLSLLISAIVISIIVLSMGLIHPDWNRAVPGGGPGRTAFVAEITDTHQVTWDASSDGNLQNRSLFVGDKLVLNAGLAEVTYDSGARVVLEGPATFEIKGVKSGMLQIGKLIALIEEPTAKDFSVNTPFALVVDRGTEFGVAVDPVEGLDVIVLSGLIDVKTDTEPARRLAKGESLNVAVDGQINEVAVTLSADQLVRKMPQPPPRGPANVINIDVEKPNDNFTFAERGAQSRSGTHWNSLSQVGAPSAPLKTSLGGPSPVTIELQGCTLARTILCDTGHRLTDDYAYMSDSPAFPDGAARFVIRGLQPGKEYQLVLYGTTGVSRTNQELAGRGAAEASLFTIDGVTKATAGLRTGDAHFSEGKDFVKFRNVVADERGEIQGSWANNPNANAPFNTNSYGVLNGLQIVGQFTNSEDEDASR